MRAIGVNRRPADNRLAAAVPTARRKAAALGGTVLQTATDQRRAVKAALSGRLTESTAPGSGRRPSHRHRTWRAGAGAPRGPARRRPPAPPPPRTGRAGPPAPTLPPRRRPLASPARTRCSTASSTPRNLTSGRRPRRLAPKLTLVANSAALRGDRECGVEGGEAGAAGRRLGSPRPPLAEPDEIDGDG